MDVLQTIEKPWREPLDYLQLVFWIIIFAVVAFALWDGMKIVATYVADAATS